MWWIRLMGIVAVSAVLSEVSSETIRWPESGFTWAPAVSDTNSTLIVNLPERTVRLYRFSTGELMNGKALPSDFVEPEAVYPVGVGLRDYPTPLVAGTIRGKTKRPPWHVPQSDWAGNLAGTIVPFDSSANPFRVSLADGSYDGYFINLTDEGIGFHSTNSPASVGKMSSHGCLRMKLEHVRELYDLPIGTPVQITYNLFRMTHIPDGLRISGHDDIYKRYTPDEKRMILKGHLQYHGMPEAMLYEDEIRAVTSGKEVVIPKQRLTLIPRIIQYPKSKLLADAN